MSAYLTRADLARYVPEKALAALPTADQDAAIAAASDEADGYLAARYTLPLAHTGADLKLHVASIALWHLLGRRNHNPANPAGDAFRLRYLDAIAWLEKVRDGKVIPARVVDSTPDRHPRPEVITSPRRGW